jgi:hypothetical protein
VLKDYNTKKPSVLQILKEHGEIQAEKLRGLRNPELN